jgi:hypothetical protein
MKVYKTTCFLFKRVSAWRNPDDKNARSERHFNARLLSG